MPSLGADMRAGTLVQWLVQPGDPVKRGQIIAEVETDKGAVEVEIFEDGIVDRLLVEPFAKVPVGTPLALIGGSGVASSTHPEPIPRRNDEPVTEPTPPPQSPVAPPGKPGVRVSPLARKRAAELGVDATRLAGTGANGAVTLADVERAAAGPKSDRPAAMRGAIAAAMSRSKREIPHYYLAAEIELARTLDWVARHNVEVPLAARVLPAAVLLKAVAAALRETPNLNGFYRDGRFEPSSAIHLGVGIALRQGGLVAPAIHDADRKSIGEVMAALGDLIRRVRGGSIRSSELADPTATVTNLGEQGVREVYGVIFPPQVAIVGVGKITERPWAERGMLAVRPVVTVTLAADHRASDGHDGSRFLNTMDRLLQAPEAL